jgi:hypothetical protein
MTKAFVVQRLELIHLKPDIVDRFCIDLGAEQ